MTIEKLGPVRAAAILCTLGALVHLQCLDVGYLSDDFDLLGAATSSRFDLLRDPFPAGRGTYFRPLVILSLRIEHALCPGPWLHHLVNLSMHLTSGVLVFALARCLSVRLVWAMAAAIVFLVHPSVTPDVNWISGRTDVLATMFSLGALCAFVRASRVGKGGLLFAPMLLVLALASKEVAVCVPLLASALAALLARSRVSGDARSTRGPAHGRTLLALASLYLVTVGWVGVFVLRFYRGEDVMPRPTLASLVKALVAAPLGVLWPNAYWAQRDVLVRHPAALFVAGSVGVLALSWAIRAAWRLPVARRRSASALATLVLAPLLPLVVVGLVPTTRLLYFPLATSCVAAAIAASAGEWRSPRLLSAVFAGLVVVMIGASVSRGRVWVNSTEQTAAFCEDFKALKRESGRSKSVFVSFPFELDEAPLHWLHLNVALAACLSDARSFNPLEVALFGPVRLSRVPSGPVVEASRVSVDEVELRASDETFFAFDVPLTPNVPVSFPEATLTATELRQGRRVGSYRLALTTALLDEADLLYFDGLHLRKVPAPSR